MLLTLAVMVGGVVVMAVGGKLNAKYSNKLMQWRVILQGLAILLVSIIVGLASS